LNTGTLPWPWPRVLTMAASSNASLAPITGTCWSTEILPRPMMAILRLGIQELPIDVGTQLHATRS
jgi:hypothetical protein